MVLKIKELVVPNPILHILVCVNSREHLPEPKLPDCHSVFSKADLKEFRNWIRSEKLLLKVKVTATHCLGMCSDEGSICLVYPEQKYYVFNTVEDLKELVFKKLN